MCLSLPALLELRTTGLQVERLEKKGVFHSFTVFYSTFLIELIALPNDLIILMRLKIDASYYQKKVIYDDTRIQYTRHCRTNPSHLYLIRIEGDSEGLRVGQER